MSAESACTLRQNLGRGAIAQAGISVETGLGLRQNPSVGSSTFTAQFQLQPGDVRALSRHVMRSRESVRAIVGALLVLLALLFGSSFLYQRRLNFYYVHRIGPVTGPPGAALQAMGAPLLLFCGFWLFLMWHHKPLRGFNTRTPISITLSNEGITHQSSSEIQTTWAAVRIEATKNHLFLWVPSNKILIVPRRAFDSDEEFARFCDFARQRCEEQKPLVPPIAQV